MKRRCQEGVQGLGFAWQRFLSKQGSCEWESPGISCLGLTSVRPPRRPVGRAGGGRLGDRLHMKGLTVLWMCLCCLRPEDVANVFPQSGQA